MNATVAVARTSDVDCAGLGDSPAVRRYTRSRDRADARAARALLLGLLPPGSVLAQRCPGCGGDDHGRPEVVGHVEIGVSLTHADGWVGAAIGSAGAGPVGLDLEPVTKLRNTPPVAIALTAPERDWLADHPDPAVGFGRLWTRKEALVKAGFCDLDAALALTVLEPPPGWRFTDHSTPDVVATSCTRAAP